MPIFKVSDKFFAKSKLFSPTFTCSEDPRQTSFQIHVEFTGNEIKVSVNSTSRAVGFLGVDFTFFDKNMRRVDGIWYGPSGDSDKILMWRLEKLEHSFSRPTSLDGDELDELRLLVDISYCGEIREDYSHKTDFYKILCYNMGSLFDELQDDENENRSGNKDLRDSDLIICVEDEEIRCHKIVLAARSEYFRGFFESGMIGSQDEKITFGDIPAREMKQLITMLYGGFWCFRMVDDPRALFPIADRFLFPDIKEFCVHSIRNQLDPSNVIEVLLLTHFYDLSELFQACIPVFKSNRVELEAHDDWSLLKDLGLVEKINKACERDDFEPPEDKESQLDELNEYRLPYLVEKMGNDMKVIYAAVAENNGGFVANTVSIKICWG